MGLICKLCIKEGAEEKRQRQGCKLPDIEFVDTTHKLSFTRNPFTNKYEMSDHYFIICRNGPVEKLQD